SEGERTWLNATHGDIEEWVEVEANAKRYVEAVEAGDVFIANADGTENTTYTVTGNASRGWTKSATGYWTARIVEGVLSYYPLGWGGNMEAIVKSLIGTTMELTDAVDAEENYVDFFRNSENGNKWELDGVVSGATLSDFVDYYMVAKRAYTNAQITE
ncbi:MAG: hypothetical protein IH571_07300, partial [Acholeplasmataceae bacterium]|nr:hypothetical protein [Acholeplasmataceae bacterium]